MMPPHRRFGKRGKIAACGVAGGQSIKEQEMAKKTTCPISREQFRAKAKQVPITIAGQQLAADVKEFSTGSLVWYLNGKTTIEIAGVLVSVPIGLNLTIGVHHRPP